MREGDGSASSNAGSNHSASPAPESLVARAVAAAGTPELLDESNPVVVGLPPPVNSTDDVQQDPAVPIGNANAPIQHDVVVEPLVAAAVADESNPVEENVVVELPPPPVSSGTNDVRQDPAPAVPTNRKRLDEETENLESGSAVEQESNVCPICMVPWTNSGEHRICALACGHLYGKSCIKRWLQQAGRKYGKCPHCNKRAKWEDIRPLFVPHVAVVDGESQKLVQEVQVLRAENERLKSENTKLLKEVHQCKERHGTFTKSSIENHRGPIVIPGPERVQGLGRSLFSRQSSHAGPSAIREEVNSRNQSRNTGGSFVLQNVVDVHGGKVFDMDAESQTVIFSNKIVGCGSSYGLSKMSLLACTEIEKIDFPPGFGAIRDVRLSPSGSGGPGKLALVASIGKKLSVMSLENNNIALTYSLQSPPWACAWDPVVPNLSYCGLQNGSLLTIDLRQTSSPLATLNGPTIRPIHCLRVIPDQSTVRNRDSGGTKVLSASSSGIFLWNLGSSAAASETIRPDCVFSDNEKSCVSLAYEGSMDTAVASFRRSPSAQTKPSSSYTPGLSSGQDSSQPLDGQLVCMPSTGAISQQDPSHLIFIRGQESSCSQINERNSSGEVHPHWRWAGAMVGHTSQKAMMPRTTIVSEWKSSPRSKPLFACGDEGTNAVWLWDMESLKVTDTLVPHESPVLDINSVQVQGKYLMGCLSERTFHLYKRLPLAD